MIPRSLHEKIAVIAATAIALYHKSHMPKTATKRTRRRNGNVSAKDMQLNLGFSNQFRRVSDNLDPHTFRRMFRVSRRAFAKLALESTPHISKQKQEGTKFRSETLEDDTRLAITLHILAGGAIIDVMVTCGIGSSTAYKVLHDTVGVFDRVLSFAKLPADEEGFAKAAREFKTSRQSQSPLDGCVGSLDGICIKIKKPDEESIPTSFSVARVTMQYPCRLCAILTACLDMHLVFVVAQHTILLPTLCPGLGRKWKKAFWGVLFWVAGDKAYPVSEYIIVPFPSSTLSEEESNFTFFLSSLRIHIEQAFGMLMARWRILRNGLDVFARALLGDNVRGNEAPQLLYTGRQ